MLVARKGQETLTSWTHFQEAFSTDCHKGPGDTHILDTFSGGLVNHLDF